MQLKAFLLAAAVAAGSAVTAQTTYLQLGHEDYPLLDRLETRSGRLSDNLFTTVKPVSRKALVPFLEAQRTMADSIGLTAIDRYNIDHMISVSGEWAENGDGAIDSKLPWFKGTFYKKQPDLVHVKTDNFFLSLNPVLAVQGIYESTDPDVDNPLLLNSRGIEARGRIANKIGFYTFFTDNQENPVSYVGDFINRREAVPGADYFQTPGENKVDYLQARGYIDFAAVKDHINVTFGYDKQYWGDGIRSLFLSDFAANATFLRLNTRIWKLNYQNLYMELTPQYQRSSDTRLGHKYATMHHLSINATKWLNVGLFEGVVFDRKDRYEFSYMVPIIFYRQIERANGSPDNALLGINFKALAAKHLQFYGQLLLDEFRFKELTSGDGWWGNKFGVQLGGKYYDAFTVKNLDLQAEINLVRPFTYTHNDSMANYTHYNQPLAHPLGAGFVELVGIARYQPIKNLYLTLKGMYYKQGVDSGSSNYGSNIFLVNTNRPAGDYGYGVVNGVKATCMLANLNASYELRENLFIDLGYTLRRYSYDDGLLPNNTSNAVYGGLRLNLARRDYSFF